MTGCDLYEQCNSEKFENEVVKKYNFILKLIYWVAQLLEVKLKVNKQIDFPEFVASNTDSYNVNLKTVSSQS